MSQPQNTIGFYYRTDDQHYTQGDLHQWISVLRSLQVRWLVLPASEKQGVPEPFIRGLLRAGVDPVIHLTSTFSSIDPNDIQPAIASYASWGARMVVVGDRPNLRRQWTPADWARGGLVEQFLDRFIPIWQAQIQHGLPPVFPPLEPGGDYWDTAFLQSCLTSLVRRGKENLARELILSIYAWTYDKPLDWGAGGPDAWPESRPYITPKGSQDQIGFCIADWYEGIARKVIDAELQIIVLGGGVEPARAHTGRDPQREAEIHAAIAETVLTGTYSKRLVGFCFYPLTGGEGQARWYGEDLAASPSAENLERLMLTAPITAPPASPVKPISHYVLLGSGENRDLARDWKSIEPYVIALRPAVGFSESAARLASQVTIIGDGAAVSEEIETRLRDQGCHVRRFNDPGSEEFLLAVAEMASDEQAIRGV
jgi:hypothetical protein